MRIWTTQSLNFFEKLKQDGEIYCNPSSDTSDNRFINEFADAYLWMGQKLKEKTGTSISESSYPLWCWYLFDGVNKKPDLRRMEFRYNNYPSVLLEIEIPDEQVLLSDELEWNMVLTSFLNKEDIDETESNKIFDIRENINHVQACFWKMCVCDVKSVRVYGRKK